ncbi:hypothetical protein ACTFIR_011849 [Dictyostelium discoideum]
MIGLDDVGKLILLYKLKLGDVVSTIPTIGFNVETIEYKNLSLTVCDLKKKFDNLLIQDELKGTQILIFANKQDMDNAMDTAEIVNSLNLNSIKDRKWYVQPCSAIKSPHGIYEGFDWIANSPNNK